MSDQSNLRWGDTQTLDYKVQAFRAGAPITTSKQLVMGQWKRPLTWAMRLAIVPAIPAGETATFTVVFLITIGVGQGVITIPFSYTLAPNAGVYSPVTDMQILPAEHVQITCQVFGAPTAANGTEQSFQVGAFIAPYTEPHGSERMYEWMQPSPEENAAAPHWMPPGFTDTPPRYR